MLAIGGILYGVGAIASLVFWIIILIKMFKTEQSPVQGIIGIFCSLWAFIWGWMNATKLGLKKTMLQWTAAIIATIIGSVIFTAAMTKKAMEMQPTTIEMPSVDMTPTE
jgi:hypothetical protein